MKRLAIFGPFGFAIGWMIADLFALAIGGKVNVATTFIIAISMVCLGILMAVILKENNERQ